MIDSVEFEPAAINDLEALDKAVRDRILKKINWLAKNFDQITPQALTDNLAGFFKLRVGDYRILYDFTSLRFHSREPDHYHHSSETP